MLGQWIIYLVILPLVFAMFLAFTIFVMVPCAFIFASWYMRVKERKLQRRIKDGANVAFFHPYCNAGGGGERVLWVAIKALLTRYPDTNIYVYTVETAEPQTIVAKAQNQFNVKVDVERITFIRLSLRKLIEAKTYPYCTLILQSLGSMALGMEAFLKLNPDIYIDTTGMAFTYPIYRYLARCPVGCYTHYPTVTAAMMRRVKHRVAAYNTPLISDIYIDTTGMAFTYPIYRYLARCPVGCYTHYPTVTAAMMRRVKHRVAAYNTPLISDIYIDTTGMAFTYPIYRYLARCPVGCYTHYPTVTAAMMRRVKHRVAAYNTPLISDIYIDTTGMAFTYPIYRYLARCPVGCYTHYPTVTAAMMRRVKHRVAAYNTPLISDIYIDTTGMAFTYPIYRYLARCPVGCYTHYPTVTAAMMRRVKHRVAAYNTPLISDIYIDTTGMAFTYPIYRYLARCPVGCYTHYPTVTAAMMRRVKHRVAAYNTPLISDIYIDTTGMAFTYPIYRYLARCPVGCYTHYPTVTAAMMRRVKHRVAAYNNAGVIARNPLLTWLKLLYYTVFGWLYGAVGRCAHVVMANGSWTEEHLRELWGPGAICRVYPPCEVAELKKLRSLVQEGDPIRILSVAQFRPEKDHPLMLQAMYELRSLLVKNEALWARIKLVLVGSCRNDEDSERVQNLRDLAKHLSLEGSVQFVVNASYAQLLQLYQTSRVALHAMWNEHFGISVVECMAAGLIVVAHRSGGPAADIVTPRGGYLARGAAGYARALLEAIALSDGDREAMIDAARASVDRFSTMEFEKAFLRATEPLFNVN